MSKQGKVWGDTTEIFNRSGVHMELLNIDGQSHCSKHLHRAKYNQFTVISGSIVIKEWSNDYDLIDRTDLNAGDSCVVKPNVMHQFVNEEDEEAVVLEMYWSQMEIDDIEREDVGGRTCG